MLGAFFKNLRGVKAHIAAAHTEDGDAGQLTAEHCAGCRCGERDDRRLKRPAVMTTNGAGLVTYKRVKLGA